MATISNPRAVTREIRNVRQARLYKPDPVPPDVLDELLEIARWTGSSRNTQPWEFIVITDRDLITKVGQIYRDAWLGAWEPRPRPMNLPCTGPPGTWPTTCRRCLP